MTAPTPFPDLQAAREQAATWVARRDRGLTGNEREEFERWRAQPANARALKEFDGLWQDLEQLRDLAPLVPATTPPATTPIRPRRTALAASIAVLALGVAALALWRTLPRGPLAPPPARVEAYATALGEHRSVTLADGSVLTLNTDTLIEVSLRDTVRALRLVRGEAHFAVAHDTARPFRVTAEGRVVQAVGTAFDVRLRERHVLDVIVNEGRVAVEDAPVNAADPAPVKAMSQVHVSAGEALRVEPDGHNALRELDARQLEALIAWRSGRLVFSGETLQQALAEFSRYTADQFEIPDPRLRELRIGGYFPTGDTRALQAALASGFGIAMTRQPNGVLRVERAPTPAPADSTH